MTRRILLVLLGFTAVIITGAVVPLALNAVAHDRASFQQAVAGTVRTDAAVALARLVHPSDPYPPLVSVLGQARQAGDKLLILKADGTVMADEGMPPGSWKGMAEQADQDGSP